MWSLTGSGRVPAVIRRFNKNALGSVALIFGITAPVALVLGGIGLSYSVAVTTKTQMQAALDAGALAGTALPWESSDNDRISAARRVYNGNFSPSGSSFQVTGGKPNFELNGVEVSGTASSKVHTVFAGLLGAEWATVSVSAAAKKMDSEPICVLGLNLQQRATIDFNGGAQLHADNCVVQANSDNGEGINQVGHPMLTAKRIGVSGNFVGSGYSPAPITGTVPVADPYASLVFPMIGSCKANDLKITNDTVALQPGTYCGGIAVQGNSTITFAPGIYIMKDGPLWMTGGTVATGKEVMFAFTGTDSTFSMEGSSTLNVTSPASGPYTNMQFFERNAVSSKPNGDLWAGVVGNNTVTFDGVMYMPDHQIWMAGGSVVNITSPTFALVGDKVWLQDHTVVNVSQTNLRGISIPPDQIGHFGYSAYLAR